MEGQCSTLTVHGMLQRNRHARQSNPARHSCRMLLGNPSPERHTLRTIVDLVDPNAIRTGQRLRNPGPSCEDDLLKIGSMVS